MPVKEPFSFLSKDAKVNTGYPLTCRHNVTFFTHFANYRLLYKANTRNSNDASYETVVESFLPS